MKPLHTLGLILAFSLPLAAQQTPCEKAARHTPAFFYCNRIDSLRSAATPDAKLDNAYRLARFYTELQGLPPAMGYSMFDAIFQHAQDTRVDKQTGAPASGSASTSLVSLPGATDLLSVAVEAGSLTQSTSGSTTTVGANIGQLVNDLTGPATLSYSLKGIPVLQNIDATISIGSNPATTNVPVTTDSGGATGAMGVSPTTSLGLNNYTVTGATARYQFFNKFDPRSSQFKSAFEQALSANNTATSAAAQLAVKTASDLILLFAPNPPGIDDTATAFAGPQSMQQTVDAFNKWFFSVMKSASADPKFKSALAAFVSAMSANLTLYRQVVNTAKGAPALTAEYTYANSVDQPATHNARIIGGFQSTDGKMLTFNAAATFYGPLPYASVSHFRDFQAAAQGDLPIAPQATNHAIDLSAAAYGQYQQTASILTVQASNLPAGFPANAPAFVAGTQGWLAVAQVKVKVSLPGSVQLTPFSYKWSNRTDVLTKADSSFQFGLSYDVSSLSQIFSPH